MCFINQLFSSFFSLSALPAQSWFARVAQTAFLPRKGKLPSSHSSSSSLRPLWYWCGDRRSDDWQAYGARDTAFLEGALSSGQPRFEFSAGGQDYVVVFSSMTQINRHTGHSRAVQRVLPEAAAAAAAAAAVAPTCASEADPRSSFFEAHPDALLSYIGVSNKLVLMILADSFWGDQFFRLAAARSL